MRLVPLTWMRKESWQSKCRGDTAPRGLIHSLAVAAGTIFLSPFSSTERHKAWRRTHVMQGCDNIVGSNHCMTYNDCIVQHVALQMCAAKCRYERLANKWYHSILQLCCPLPAARTAEKGGCSKSKSPEQRMSRVTGDCI